MKWNWIIALLIFAACQAEVEPPVESTQAEEYMPSTSAEGAAAYIITPEDGSIVQSGAVTVRFGLSGMGVAPAGVNFDNSGHHHLLINVEELPPMDMPVPADSAHIHFGLGQTETTLDLSSGTYTLQLVLGDFAHIPHDPPVVSEPVTITVE